MKVFVSWSGDISHGVALALRKWLRSVIQEVDPFVSSEDIAKGVAWPTHLAGELATSNWGIICLTPDNLHAPWMNFEAGALVKSFDTSRVSPFLFGLGNSDLSGPLSLLQATSYDRNDLRRLLDSINRTPDLPLIDDALLEASFDKWWPDLQTDLDQLAVRMREITPPGAAPATPERMQSLLEEILELVRSQQRLQASADSYPDVSRGALNDLQSAWGKLISLLAASGSEDSIPVDTIVRWATLLEHPVSYILGKGGMPNMVSPSLRDIVRARRLGP